VTRWTLKHSSLLGFGFLFTASVPHRSLAAIQVLRFDGGRQSPTSESAGPCSLLAGRGLNLAATELSSITPPSAVFGSVGVLLTIIRVGLLLFCDEFAHTRTHWPVNKITLSLGYPGSSPSRLMDPLSSSQKASSRLYVVPTTLSMSKVAKSRY